MDSSIIAFIFIGALVGACVSLLIRETTKRMEIEQTTLLTKWRLEDLQHEVKKTQEDVDELNDRVRKITDSSSK